MGGVFLQSSDTAAPGEKLQENMDGEVDPAATVTPPSPQCLRSRSLNTLRPHLRLVASRAATLLPPDVVSVFGPAEEAGRASQTIPVLPLSLAARSGEDGRGKGL